MRACHVPRIGNHGGIFTTANQSMESSEAKFRQPKADVSQDVVAEMQAGWTLTSARNDLMHAGSEWGGFGEQAIENINQAIANLNKAIRYRAQNLPKK